MYSKVQRDQNYIANLLSFINAEYELKVHSVSAAKRGFYGETWQIKTQKGDYFVKIDYSTKHKELYKKSFILLEYLHLQGIKKISLIVKTKRGELYSFYDGAILGVFNWIDGQNVQNKETKFAEYDILAHIYTLPTRGLTLEKECFTTYKADLYFSQVGLLKQEPKAEDGAKVLGVLAKNEEKILHRFRRLKHFAEKCADDYNGFFITHGDAGGNIIVQDEKYFLVDWDYPLLAPPERDAWFCLHWDWAMAAFNESLQKQGLDYTLRYDRLAFYCYHSFFYYLTEYLDAFFDLGNRGGDMVQVIEDYFSSWIEEELNFADTLTFI